MSKEQGNPLASLYPTHTRHWWPIVEDVFMSSAVQALRSSLVLSLERDREYVPWQQFVLSASLAFSPLQRLSVGWCMFHVCLFSNLSQECVSADATLKVCMALKGQASYRAKAAVRNSACFGDSEALRRLLTERGRTGAVLALVPIVSEKDEFVANALKHSLSDNARLQIQFICTDCPTKKCTTQ